MKAHQLCLALLPFTHARSKSINADSLNSNFLQLGRRSGCRPQRRVYPRRLPVNTVIHTSAGLEPTTFRLLVRRATRSATDSPYTAYSRYSSYYPKLASRTFALPFFTHTRSPASNALPASVRTANYGRPWVIGKMQNCGMRKVKCGIQKCGNVCGMVGKMWNAE